MRAIIVDDERLLLEQFMYECGDMPGLEMLGCFDSPIEALEFAKDNPIDIAFVDIMMPEMDGYELAEQLRILYPGIKVVAATSCETSVDTDDQEMDAVLLKPYEPKNLELILNELDTGAAVK